ncbi:hypothetical protein [Bdellovibrio sp. HCB2-146]|uniref:hypothetical protein n=1 Tax=Bdellovibrio sp. HCB2-146 TaxID=3394362 RepID=UPI0039BD2B2F
MKKAIFALVATLSVSAISHAGDHLFCQETVTNSASISFQVITSNQTRENFVEIVYLDRDNNTLRFPTRFETVQEFLEKSSEQPMTFKNSSGELSFDQNHRNYEAKSKTQYFKRNGGLMCEYTRHFQQLFR